MVPEAQRQPARPATNRIFQDCRAGRKACLVNYWRPRALTHRRIVSFRYPIRTKTFLAALFLVTSLLCPASRADDKEKKEKPEKEKKEKIEPWVEIRTAHFIVASDGGDKTARRFADEFETLYRVFQSTMPNSRVGTGVPVRILAARDGRSFARMAPEFPFDKHHEQPPALMFSGSEKTYIGLRANASGRFQHIEIFQNYAREVLKRSYRKLPPWLEEGYSTVYGSLTFGDKGVRLERPDPDDLSVLFESPLLPLDMVLRVDRDSPYYSPGNKQSVYFAESRVLLHYLLGDPQFSGSKAIERYLTAVQSGTDSLQAAREAFGDLNQLQAKLDAYVKYVNGPPAELSIPAGTDSGGAPRTLSAWEIEARQADFMAVRGKSEDSEDKLNEALMNEPGLAEAEQCLGFLMLKQNNPDEAQKHFDHAAQLDPKDGLNFYGQGLLAIAQGGKGAPAAGAAAAFEKSVALNAEFAPAWSNLAEIYSQRPETLQKALAAAKRAAALAPGDGRYQSQVAATQDLVDHPEDARRMAARAAESANIRTAGNSRDAAPQISVRQPPPPPSASATAPATSSPAATPRIERKTEAPAAPSTPPATATTASTAPAAPKAEPAPAPAPPLFDQSQQVYSMVGTITDVNCGSAPQIQMTLKSQTIVMKLHANDLAQLSIKSSGAATASKGANCSTMRGRIARISYLFVSGKAWDAEIQAVEFRNAQ
jgi:tetratricopeptide (TPR) repeat protein